MDIESALRNIGDWISKETELRKYPKGELLELSESLQVLKSAITRQSETEMAVCPNCGGSGIYQEYDEYDRMSTFRCPACDGAGEIMTNYDRIMRDMTVEQMAELFVRDETRQDYPDDIPYDSYTTEHTPGYYCFRDDAIKAEIEWLKKEDSSCAG